MSHEEPAPLERLRRLGLADADARAVLAHFEEADRRGKPGHGVSRVAWLETQAFDPAGRPVRLVHEAGYERWDGHGALGYLVLEEIVRSTIADPPRHARLVVAARCFPTGVLGLWASRLADAGLTALVTATSPRRLPHPSGGVPLTGTNPLAIAVPSGDGRPVVADVSMGAVTHGDVLSGRALPEELVPFGGPQAHKAFALAVGLELLVGALAGDEHGVVLLVARPDHDPVPAFRALATGRRLPGDSRGGDAVESGRSAGRSSPSGRTSPSGRSSAPSGASPASAARFFSSSRSWRRCCLRARRSLTACSRWIFAKVVCRFVLTASRPRPPGYRSRSGRPRCAGGPAGAMYGRSAISLARLMAMVSWRWCRRQAPLIRGERILPRSDV